MDFELSGDEWRTTIQGQVIGQVAMVDGNDLTSAHCAIATEAFAVRQRDVLVGVVSLRKWVVRRIASGQQSCPLLRVVRKPFSYTEIAVGRELGKCQYIPLALLDEATHKDNSRIVADPINAKDWVFTDVTRDQRTSHGVRQIQIRIGTTGFSGGLLTAQVKQPSGFSFSGCILMAVPFGVLAPCHLVTFATTLRRGWWSR